MLIVFSNIVVQFLLAYYCYNRTDTFKKSYWPLLSLKILSGIVVGLMYTYYYASGDTFTSFKDASILTNLAYDDASLYFEFLWNNNSFVGDVLSSHNIRYLFFVKIISVINIVTVNNYWLTSSYLSLLSFLSTWKFTQTLVKIIPEQKFPIIFSLFFPSIVFWSSGILKETLVVTCLFILAELFSRVWFNRKLFSIDFLLLLLAAWFLWKLKYYYAAVFLPLLFATWFTYFIGVPVLKIKSLSAKLALWVLVILLPLTIVYFLHPNFYKLKLPDLMVENYQLYSQQSKTESVIQFTNLNPTLISFLVNSPWALFSVLFRPMIWEANTMIQLLATIENLILLILTMAAFSNWRYLFKSNYYRALIYLVLVYTVVLGVSLALSAPNFGTLSRYRIGFLPFYVLIISCNNPLLIRVDSFIERTFYRLVR